MSAVLYRHFDLNGNLLYVGVSISALKRLHQHKEKSSWFDQIDTVQFEHFETIEQAKAAEKDAIQTERPAYNYHWWVANPRKRERERRAAARRLSNLAPCIYCKTPTPRCWRPVCDTCKADKRRQTFNAWRVAHAEEINARIRAWRLARALAKE